MATDDDTATCDDGDACTTTDACVSGVCVGNDPIECAASDQCHGVGTCDSATGECSDPELADGTACDDSDECTTSDICQAGACTAGAPVECVAVDQCHEAGTCDSATGACSNPKLPDGTVCDDSDACTATDQCESGTCSGNDPVQCVAMDQCHDVGTCDPSSGLCSDPPLADGSACNDANACTLIDACVAGACVGDDPVICSARTNCYDVGVCSPTDGMCSQPIKPDGTACGVDGVCLVGGCIELLAIQDFELITNAKNWGFTPNPAMTYEQGNSSATAAPADSPLGIESSRAWSTTQVSGGVQVEFDNVLLRPGLGATLSFKLAAMNLNGSSGGPDNLDYVLVEISTDGGATYYGRVRIRGALANNSTWSYAAATTAAVNYLPQIEEVFQPANSGSQEVDGISTIEITFPNTVTQVRVRITPRSSSSSDTWLIDDLKLISE